jgi:hypothetical protein
MSAQRSDQVESRRACSEETVCWGNRVLFLGREACSKNEGVGWRGMPCVWLRQIGVRGVAYRTPNLGPLETLQVAQLSPPNVSEISEPVNKLHLLPFPIQMGVQKKTRKFAQVKRIIGQRDARLKKNQLKGEDKTKPKGDDVVREM